MTVISTITNVLRPLPSPAYLVPYSLRTLVDNMQMDLQMANARLYDEMQNQPAREVVHSCCASPGWVSEWSLKVVHVLLTYLHTV